jgi:hypothetical protein
LEGTTLTFPANDGRELHFQLSAKDSRGSSNYKTEKIIWYKDTTVVHEDESKINLVGPGIEQGEGNVQVHTGDRIRVEVYADVAKFSSEPIDIVIE